MSTNTDTSADDTVTKFLFKNMQVRGILVRLTHEWKAMLERQQKSKDWSPAVSTLLGQMTAAGLFMQSNIKFKGALVLQIFGDGPLKLAVVETLPNLQFRATAKTTTDIAADASLSAMANASGKGRCAITLDPKEKLPGQTAYQGMVGLSVEGIDSPSLAQVLEHYMRQSEQLESKIVLAADDNAACGLLIQRLPGTGAEDSSDEDADEDFQRICALTASLSPTELLTLDPKTVLHRLFWQEELSLYQPLQTRFQCSCNQERIEKMIQSLGQEEAQSILDEQGAITVDCEFCAAHYQLNAEQTLALFRDSD